MNTIYDIGKTSITEKELHEYCHEIIELLKAKKITYAVAEAILLKTIELLKENIL